jgi:metal-dependent amidase/aminoacylase/carboxypeptidase family protein
MNQNERLLIYVSYARVMSRPAHIVVLQDIDALPVPERRQTELLLRRNFWRFYIDGFGHLEGHE